MPTAPRKFHIVAEVEEEETLAMACVIETAKKAAKTRMRLELLDSHAATTMALAKAAADRAGACRREAKQLQYDFDVAVEKYKECFLKRVEMVAVEQATIEAAAVNEAAAENDRMNVCPWEAGEIAAANMVLPLTMPMTHSVEPTSVMNAANPFWNAPPFKPPSALPPTRRESAQNSSTYSPQAPFKAAPALPPTRGESAQNSSRSSPPASFKEPPPTRRECAQNSSSPLPTSSSASSAMNSLEGNIFVKSAPRMKTSSTQVSTACGANCVRSKAPPPVLCLSQDVAAEVSLEFPSVDAYDE